jgi:hypothetical protein
MLGGGENAQESGTRFAHPLLVPVFVHPPTHTGSGAKYTGVRVCEAFQLIQEVCALCRSCGLNLCEHEAEVPISYG